MNEIGVKWYLHTISRRTLYTANSYNYGGMQMILTTVFKATLLMWSSL